MTNDTTYRATDVPGHAAPVMRRPSTEEDNELLYRIYASTRDVEMALVPWTDEQKIEFLRQQHHAQHTFYHREFPDAHYDILLQDGQPIGRIYVDRRPTTVGLMDIALLPEHRGAGIGTALLRETMADAAREGLPLRLHVETFNPAQNLYKRLGFVQLQEDGIYIEMEWKGSLEL